MHQFAFFGLRLIAHNGIIGFMHFALFKHLIYALKRLACFSEEDNATHGPVEPVNYAQKRTVGLILFFSDVFFNLILQRFVTRIINLHNISRAFVYGNKVIILIKNIFISNIVAGIIKFRSCHLVVC